MNSLVHRDSLDRLLKVEHHNPFEILGCHTLPEKDKYIIRALAPDAEDVHVRIKGFHARRIKMQKVEDGGLFELILKSSIKPFYDLEITDNWGYAKIFPDVYSFPKQISDLDLHLISEGNHHRIYDVLGASVKEIDGFPGVLFAVWAPGVKAVSVIGDFNDWDKRVNPMRVRRGTGVWELFIPGVRDFAKYKFFIKTRDGGCLEKADPYSRFAEYRPQTASVVYNLKKYNWNDKEWMLARKKMKYKESPMLIYEVHLGSWMKVAHESNRSLTYRELAEELVPYVKAKGFTHIQLLPVSEHPFDGSWGYQVTGYYATTSRFGTPTDFMYLIDQCHQNNIGVILDIVPGHFPRDPHGLSMFTGEYVYEHPDPLRREHPHWGTNIFDYGRNEVRNFLVANPLFWFDKFHIDGIRVDAVASMLYLDYGRENLPHAVNRDGGKENLEAIDCLKQMNTLIHKYYPDTISIAEESTAWPMVSHPVQKGGLGFDFKWNMGWMNDTLRYFQMDPILRKYNQDLITFSISFAYSENFILVLSHDEVVHGKCSLFNKMPGNLDSKFAHLKLLFGYTIGHSGKKLIFMGQEFGQSTEWNHDHSLDWHYLDYFQHQALQSFTTALFHLYRKYPCLWEDDTSYGGFEWIDFKDSDRNLISFIRQDAKRERHLIFVMNFSPVPREKYLIGCPVYSRYFEIFNSDAEIFGGNNIGNAGQVHSFEMPWQDRPFSMEVNIPPLGFVIFEPETVPEKEPVLEPQKSPVSEKISDSGPEEIPASEADPVQEPE
ncbi:1,4-alpha-glucan branching protein GlgB [Candidatus Riflebacteria bacterium]